jgi:CBS domain-containing protein
VLQIPLAPLAEAGTSFALLSHAREIVGRRTHDEESVMSVLKYCFRAVRTAAPEETVRAAAQRMRAEEVGCLVVTDQGRPLGIATDRDIALGVLREDREAEKLPLRDLMQSPVVTVSEDVSLLEAVKTLRRASVRRLVVVDGLGRVVGLLTADDVLRLVATELGDLAEALRVQLSQEAKAAPRGVEEASGHA